MKLELKHLAPYLPYGLLISSESKLMRNRTLVCGIYDQFGLNDSVTIEQVLHEKAIFKKPILRPLSDLIKEIHYGLSSYAFVDLFEIGDCDGCVFEFEHGNIKTINSISSIAQHSSYNDINYLPSAVVNIMIEHHFDVFGLIDSGLAIDINTLNK